MGFQGGYLGVDVFFVLSGYLITSILYVEFETLGTIDLLGFYRRRVLRLFPALLVMCAVVGLYTLLVTDLNAGNVGKNMIASLFYVSNWTRAFNVGFPTFLGHTWSLAIEEQYYLIWPVILFLFLKNIMNRRYLFFAVFLLTVVATLNRSYLAQIGASPVRLYNGFDTRYDALLLGSLAAFLINHGQKKDSAKLSISAIRRFWPLALIAIATIMGSFQMEDPFMFHAGFLIVAISSVILVIACLETDQTLLGKALARGPLVYIGKISYSLYLWHYPIFYFLRSEYKLSNNWTMAVGIPICFLIAALSHHFVEKPFLKRRYASNLTGIEKFLPLSFSILCMTIGILFFF